MIFPRAPTLREGGGEKSRGLTEHPLQQLKRALGLRRLVFRNREAGMEHDVVPHPRILDKFLHRKED